MTLAPCIYCGAPWPDIDADLDHAACCPALTGLYPVRPVDLRPNGFCCLGCGEPFKVGDAYVLTPLESSGTCVGCTCLTCAAFNRVCP